ncbi:MAG: TonB-dependent receptor [Bacteroidetes bacterium]|nr:MAG: TonB-dependent receptor [Bacteroidota bacterium]
MNKSTLSLCALAIAFLFALNTTGQTISGYVKDSATGEALIGALVKAEKSGTAADIKGFFSLKVSQGVHTITVTYLGYQSQTLTVDVSKDVILNIRLPQTGIKAKEAVVTGERNNKNVTSTEMSRVELTGEQVKTLPVIFGEPDVLKAITLLPGIKSGGEGGTGFYVRGGGPDQNLVLMDDAVIYNPSHLLGFLSVFNTDAVRNVEVIKGGMPANYGGRLSSILNVNLKEGNDKEYDVSGGVGLISSRLMFEGPIKKGKSAFMVAGRRTYIDALVKPFLTTEQKANGYYFYDFNAKAHFNIDEKNKIIFSGYFGRDIFTFKSPVNKLVKFQVGWGNAAASLRWYHSFNKKLYSNTVAIYNRYDLNNKFEFGENGFQLSSGLQDWNIKHDFYYTPSSKHQIKTGVQYIYHTFTPGIATGQVGTISIDERINKQYAHESAVYFLDEFKAGKRFTINAGLRLVSFTQVGPFTEKIFDDQDVEIGNGKSYGKGEPIKTYLGLEPRFAATYLLNSNTSLKASFTRTYQFLHLATTSGAQFPADLWVPSSKLVRPQIAYQYAVGLFKNFNENAYETSIEAYYKPMFNQIEFKPGAELFFNQNLENEMIFGQGLSYGIEVFGKKKFGKLTGWIGYTWSRTTRQFDELNQGEPFFFRYDRTHDISLVGTYQINAKWSGTMVFVYGTGNAATLPTGRYAYRAGYDIEKNEPKFTFVDLYDKVNDFRLPAYHRLDISFTYIKKKTARYESSWNFSIYNLYNRANPYFIYFVPDVDALKVRAYMVYLFPILPSVAWNFKF